jgi:hypothetical protein
VTHFQPPTFPLLLVGPALVFDVLLRRRAGGRDLRLATVLGIVFVLGLLVLQWPFADFLLSPAARNPIFVADHWTYSSHLGPWRYRYWSLDVDKAGNWSAVKFWSGIAVATLWAIVTSWIGLKWGRWMSRVQR